MDKLSIYQFKQYYSI